MFNLLLLFLFSGLRMISTRVDPTPDRGTDLASYFLEDDIAPFSEQRVIQTAHCLTGR